MRIPYDAPDSIIYDEPVVRERVVLPADGGSIIRPSKRVGAEKPAEELRSDPAMKPVEKSKLKAKEGPTPAEKPADEEPKDTDPTGDPKIDAQKPAGPDLKAPEGTKAKPAQPSDKEKSGDKAA
jgi:hypothetical protein